LFLQEGRKNRKKAICGVVIKEVSMKASSDNLLLLRSS
jgi:hypothetical protein